MLTNQFIFQPEMIIEINGVVYAVFLDKDEELGDFPILAKVDSPNFLTVDTEITEMDDAIFAATFGYAFRGHEDLLVSDIIAEGEQKDYKTVMDVAEAKLEERAKETGMSWLLDEGVQAAFLAATLTGVPVSLDDLDKTEWFNNSSEDQRNFMAKYYANPSLVEDEIKTNIANIKETMISMNMKGPINELAKALAYGVASFTIKADEVNTLLEYIDDPTYLDMIGGLELLPENLQPFVGKFTGVNVGQSETKGYILDILGMPAYENMVASGSFNRLAARVKAGDGAGVKAELQEQHDVLYPMFKGSQHSIWNGQFANRASRLINGTSGNQIVSLSTSQQEDVDRIIVETKGDFQAFDAAIRSEFINSPGVKNQFLNQLASKLPQAISGVY
jgi:hypothetical protein